MMSGEKSSVVNMIVRIALVFLLGVQLVFIEGTPDGNIREGYFNYYQCILQCYKDVFELSYIHGDLCKGTVQLDTDDSGDVPFEWITESIQCITVSCRSSIPPTICEPEFSVSLNQYGQTMKSKTNKENKDNSFISQKDQLESLTNAQAFDESTFLNKMYNNIFSFDSKKEVFTSDKSISQTNVNIQDNSNNGMDEEISDENKIGRQSNDESSFASVFEELLPRMKRLQKFSSDFTGVDENNEDSTTPTVRDNNSDKAENESGKPVDDSDETNDESEKSVEDSNITDDEIEKSVIDSNITDGESGKPVNDSNKTDSNSTENDGISIPNIITEKSVTDSISITTIDVTVTDYSEIESTTEESSNEFSTTECTTGENSDGISTTKSSIVEITDEFLTTESSIDKATEIYFVTESTTGETTDFSTTESMTVPTTVSYSTQDNVTIKTTEDYSTTETATDFDLTTPESTLSTEDISYYDCSNFDDIDDCRNYYYLFKGSSEQREIPNEGVGNFDASEKAYSESPIETTKQYSNNSPQNLYSVLDSVYLQKSSPDYFGNKDSNLKTQPDSSDSVLDLFEWNYQRNRLNNQLPITQGDNSWYMNKPSSNQQFFNYQGAPYARQYPSNRAYYGNTEFSASNQDSVNAQSAPTDQVAPINLGLENKAAIANSPSLRNQGSTWQSSDISQDFHLNQNLGNGRTIVGDQSLYSNQLLKNTQLTAENQAFSRNQRLGNLQSETVSNFLSNQGSGNRQSATTPLLNQGLGNRQTAATDPALLLNQRLGSRQPTATGKALLLYQGLGNRQSAAGPSLFLSQGLRNRQSTTTGPVLYLNQGLRNRQSIATNPALFLNQGLGNRQSTATNPALFLNQGLGNRQSTATNPALFLNQGLGNRQLTATDTALFLNEGLGNSQSTATDPALFLNQGLGNRQSTATNPALLLNQELWNKQFSAINPTLPLNQGLGNKQFTTIDRYLPLNNRFGDKTSTATGPDFPSNKNLQSNQPTAKGQLSYWDQLQKHLQLAVASQSSANNQESENWQSFTTGHNFPSIVSQLMENQALSESQSSVATDEKPSNQVFYLNQGYRNGQPPTSGQSPYWNQRYRNGQPPTLGQSPYGNQGLRYY